MLAHEFGHIKNRDILVSTIATIILAPIAAMLLQLAVSRQREYLADARQARLSPRAVMGAQARWSPPEVGLPQVLALEQL